MRCVIRAAAAAALVLPLVATPSPAEQGGQQGGGPPPLNGSYTLHLLTAEGDFGRAEYGDFDGDGQEDIVFLAGERLDVLFAPGLHETLITDIANPQYQGHLTRDFSVVREPQGKDRILLVDDTGLVELEVQSTQPFVSVQREELGGFPAADRLDVWDNGDGRHWAAGAHGNGGTLYTATDGGGSWTPGPPLPTGATSPALDLVLFDDDGDGQDPMVVFLLASGFGTFDPWGSRAPEFNSAGGVTYRDVARLGRGGAPDPDGLVFLGDVAAGPFLISYCEEQTSSFQLLPASEQFYSVTTGRYDLDALDDLILAGRGSEQLFVIVDAANDASQLPNFSFDPEFHHSYQSDPGDAGSQSAMPLLVDLDHDGDCDPTVAVEAQLHFWIGRNGTFDAAAKAVKFNDDAFNPPGHDPQSPPFGGHLYYEEVDTDGDGVPDDYAWWIDLEVTLPSAIPSPYLDVLTWRNPANQTGIVPTPVDSQRILATGKAGTTVTVSLSVDEPGEAIVDDEWIDQLYTVFQFVDAPGLELPQTWCYPARAIVFAPDSETFAPPHVPGEIFLISKTLPFQPLPDPGSGPIPNGNGDDTDCVPSNRPPVRP